jgi:hypothetical protein
MARTAKHLTAPSISEGHKLLNEDRAKKSQPALTFKAYREQYGPKGQWGMDAPKPAAVEPVEEEIVLNDPTEVALIKAIQDATNALEAIRSAKAAPVVEAQVIPIRKAAPKSDAKPRDWNAYIVERKGLPTTVGAQFDYVSKKHSTVSTHKVVKVNGDGSIVTERVSLTKGNVRVAA